jgi:flagellar assembly protein FliH
MPLLSKAKLLGESGERAGEMQEFVYRGMCGVPADGAATSAVLPAGRELLWAEAPPEPEKDSGDRISPEEMQAREQAARQRGFEEGVAQARANFEKALVAERSGLAAALGEFAKGRQAYYQKIEEEVVRLVLSIARKVLHRESQLDPMLLSGVVRVALDKMSAGTVVKLRVPPSQVDAWRAAVRSMPVQNLRVETSADESLTGPRCLIITEMGTTDASLEAQLGEIERGFFDLLSQRPAHTLAAADSDPGGSAQTLRAAPAESSL